MRSDGTTASKKIPISQGNTDPSAKKGFTDNQMAPLGFVGGGNTGSRNFCGNLGGRGKFSLCVGCGGPIHDQFILRVAPNLEWHAACLKCNECQMFLDENCTCFVRDGKTYCKKDYIRLFGAKCDKCDKSFGKSDYVMRAKNKIFHLDCFRCSACEKQLVPGDEFSLKHDELLCKEDSLLAKDFDNNNSIMNNHLGHGLSGPGSGGGGSLHGLLHHNTSNSSEDNSEAPCDLSDEDMSVIDSQEDLIGSSSSGKKLLHLGGGGGPGSSASSTSGGGSGSKKGSDRKSARARTVLSEKQLNILKTCYSANPRPDALMKEQLVEMTALSPRVIRVWFQNKRCKDKKIHNRLMEKQIQRETDGRKLAYGSMHGIPMVASSPVRHGESPLAGGPSGPGGGPVDVHSYEPPWKALTDFALHTDLDRLNPGNPHFNRMMNQMHGFPPEGGPPPPFPPAGGPHDMLAAGPPGMHGPPPPLPPDGMPPYPGDYGMPPMGGPDMNYLGDPGVPLPESSGSSGQPPQPSLSPPPGGSLDGVGLDQPVTPVSQHDETAATPC